MQAEENQNTLDFSQKAEKQRDTQSRKGNPGIKKEKKGSQSQI